MSSLPDLCRLLHPQNFLSPHNTGVLTPTDEESADSLIQRNDESSSERGRPGAYASQDAPSRYHTSSPSVLPSSYSTSNEARSSNIEDFFSRTPDDIRASTVQLSMLTFLPPRPPLGAGPAAHSNYLAPGGPASFPLRQTWSPPHPPSTNQAPLASISPVSEADGRIQSARAKPALPAGVNPSQIRTPVTAANLAALSLGRGRSSQAPRAEEISQENPKCSVDGQSAPESDPRRSVEPDAGNTWQRVSPSSTCFSIIVQSSCGEAEQGIVGETMRINVSPVSTATEARRHAYEEIARTTPLIFVNLKHITFDSRSQCT